MAKRILLDMDGVLADFIGGACKAHGRPSPYTEPDNLGKWDIDKLWGMDSDAFWAPLLGCQFWLNLEPTVECMRIIELAVDSVGRQNVGICTRPPCQDYPESVRGKRGWIRRHCPELIDRMVFCIDKTFCANPNTLLIDDNEHNITSFWYAGGSSVLVPRPWNVLHELNDWESSRRLSHAVNNFILKDNDDR